MEDAKARARDAGMLIQDSGSDSELIEDGTYGGEERADCYISAEISAVRDLSASENGLEKCHGWCLGALVTRWYLQRRMAGIAVRI